MSKLNTLSLFAISMIALFLLVAPEASFAFQTEELENEINRRSVAGTVAAKNAKQEKETKQDAESSKKSEGKETSAEQDDEPEIDTADSNESGELLDPKWIRLHMWDGSIVSGQILVEAITVNTEFGGLSVPVHRVVQFNPGLDSLKPLNDKLMSLVEQLGSRNFDERESSHRALAKMGLQLREIINDFDDGGSAERKKHLDVIKKEIQELLDDVAELGSGESQWALVRGDTIETEDFTIVGQIQETSFQVKTKYGLLDINLADVKMGERKVASQAPDIRKNVTVSATAFWQTTPVSTKIRVNRGDRVSIKATGNVVWQSWSNVNSTPDGIATHGKWRNIQSGTLVAKVGSSDEPIKIGSSGEFIAKSSGELQLCVAIQDSYAKNNGYRWNGNYKARVLVRPAGTK